MILANAGVFYDRLRNGLFSPHLVRSEVDGIDAILAATAAWPLAWTAYGLATPYLETAHTMQPIRELGGQAYFTRMYDPEPAGQRPHVAAALGNIHSGDGPRFAGRGYVQLTGRANYARASNALHLGTALVDDPDRALEPAIAAEILARGMSLGWFSGRKLSDFLPAQGGANRAAFIECRRIINGQDRADLIADYAVEFQNALALATAAAA